MSEEKRLQSFRRVVAESIALGRELQEHRGPLWEAANRSLWEQFDRLYVSTNEFLEESALEELSADQIFPLHAEMKRVLLQQQQLQRS